MWKGRRKVQRKGRKGVGGVRKGSKMGRRKKAEVGRMGRWWNDGGTVGSREEESKKYECEDEGNAMMHGGGKCRNQGQ